MRAFAYAAALSLALLHTPAATEALGGRPLAQGAPAKPLAGLDTYSFAITTDSAEAQQWFDRGLLLLYGFNHPEAIRSFERAAELDPDAAMPWWGIAYANGMHINFPEVSEAQWQSGYNAAMKAVSLLDDETQLEHDLVNAVLTRCAWPAPEEQRPYDEAFARAMQGVHARYPDHPDVGVMYVESLMNLQPWDYWTADLEPKHRTAEFVRVIESVLEAQPDHPQACHLYIHALEAGPDPSRAEAAADALVGRVPGAGHLQHMPSHLYARIGRYADAVTVNQQAIESDDRFFELGNDPGTYFLYHAHNVHFLAFAAMMEGRYDIAMSAARRLENSVPDEVLDELNWIIEGIMPTTRHVQIRFGKWEDILAEPAPPAKRPLALAIHHYSRGIALAALGRTEQAREEVALFRAQADQVPDHWYIFNNPVHKVLPIASHMLDGELAYREGRHKDAWESLQKGIELEDQLIYDEPPAWMIPVRHAMGALLMEAGEHEWAERLYRRDQVEHPGNGWSLVGLKNSLDAQGRIEESRVVQRELDRAWQRVTDRPTSSCYCAPAVIAE